ncbi:MAG TPA: 3-isopropylmalate dehydrogenase [Bacteroides sp.]|nr:3-isopropylmalate dehydrogenase [Bacteroides sp.]
MTFKIVVLPGDGIGPEVTKQALKLLPVIAEKENVEFVLEEGLIGATAIDQTGNPLPDDTIEKCLGSDAVLLGAVGHPKYDLDPTAKVRPEQGLLKIRKSLGLFANIRPVKTFPELDPISPLKDHLLKGVDFIVYRELTGGIYFGEKGRSEDGTEAWDHCNYSAGEIERIARMAFETAGQRRKKLTLVDKANVLETSRLWRETVQNLAPEYPDIDLDFMFVDNAAMQIILQPSFFDVILTENMFGDIITDEASVIVGSIGMLPSASVGDGKALFEPIHGSAPQIAGKDIANPFATILSLAMMMDHFGLVNSAENIRRIVTDALGAGIVTGDIKEQEPKGTTEVGDWVYEQLKSF